MTKEMRDKRETRDQGDQALASSSSPEKPRNIIRDHAENPTGISGQPEVGKDTPLDIARRMSQKALQDLMVGKSDTALTEMNSNPNARPRLERRHTDGITTGPRDPNTQGFHPAFLPEFKRARSSSPLSGVQSPSSEVTGTMVGTVAEQILSDNQKGIFGSAPQREISSPSFEVKPKGAQELLPEQRISDATIPQPNSHAKTEGPETKAPTPKRGLSVHDSSTPSDEYLMIKRLYDINLAKFEEKSRKEKKRQEPNSHARTEDPETKAPTPKRGLSVHDLSTPSDEYLMIKRSYDINLATFEEKSRKEKKRREDFDRKQQEELASTPKLIEDLVSSKMQASGKLPISDEMARREKVDRTAPEVLKRKLRELKSEKESREMANNMSELRINARKTRKDNGFNTVNDSTTDIVERREHEYAQISREYYNTEIKRIKDDHLQFLMNERSIRDAYDKELQTYYDPLYSIANQRFEDIKDLEMIQRQIFDKQQEKHEKQLLSLKEQLNSLKAGNTH